LGLALFGVCLLAPQDPDLSGASAAFRALDPIEQQLIVRRLERSILFDPDQLLQDIMSKQQSFEHYPLAPPRAFHDPARWAPGVAPDRTVIAAGTPEHAALRARIPAIDITPHLHKAVFYDWGSGQVVRREHRLSDPEFFDNLLHGYPPGADAAVAHVIALLDNDAKQRKLASYYEHLYADLEARVFEGVTIYEGWYSEQIVDVPDVDSVPFAREILGTHAYRSPIPAGRKRAALYQQIRDHAVVFRDYRTLRESAALAFVTADPQCDPKYRLLVPRFHYLLAKADNDVAVIAETLEKTHNRARLLETVDKEIESGPSKFQMRELRRDELRALANKLREMALGSLPP